MAGRRLMLRLRVAAELLAAGHECRQHKAETKLQGGRTERLPEKANPMLCCTWD